jgi:hypothetical protein
MTVAVARQVDRADVYLTDGAFVYRVVGTVASAHR